MFVWCNMTSIVKFLFCFVVAFLLAGVCLGQTVDSSSDSKVNVRFVDTAGKPVTPETALFFNVGRAKAITVKDGTGVVPVDTRIVVAKADGFQFTGTIVNGDDAKVVFRRDDEPYPQLTQTPYPLNDQIKADVTEQVKKSLWEKIKDQDPKSMDSAQTVRVVAAVDPVGALKWLDENKMPHQQAGMVFQSALEAMLQTDPEEVFDRISQRKNPMERSAMLLSFLKELSSDDPSLKALETQVIEVTREIKQPAMRLAMRSGLAEHYAMTGRPDLADKIVQQHIEEVKKLPSGGWSALPRSLFAALVVEKDPKLAEELIKGNRDQGESNRAHARVAFQCCRTNPDLAVELLSRCEQPDRLISAWSEPTKVCHRMAIEQTEAARKLVGSFDERNQQAWALGLMAMRLNKSNSALAKTLLAQAIESLSDPAAWNQQWHPLGATLAGLLPIAQQVEPAKVQPLMWQAIFETLPRTRWIRGTSNKIKIQSVAGAIARYDVELGRALVGKSEIDLGNMFAESTVRQALLNPSGLSQHVEKVCALESRQRHRTLSKLTELVTQNESEFWNAISKPENLRWPTERFEEF